MPIKSVKKNPVACSQTDRVTTEGTLSGFHDFFFQPIIKERQGNTYFFVNLKICAISNDWEAGSRAFTGTVYRLPSFFNN